MSIEDLEGQALIVLAADDYELRVETDSGHVIVISPAECDCCGIRLAAREAA